jgi:hypothetical protein
MTRSSVDDKVWFLALTDDDVVVSFRNLWDDDLDLRILQAKPSCERLLCELKVRTQDAYVTMLHV